MIQNHTKTITRVILEKIAEVGEGVLDTFFPAKYPEARLWRELLGNKNQKFTRSSFSTILSRLRAQGLVERRGSRKEALWRISLKGTMYLRKPDGRPPKSDGIQRLVIFDIPEKMRSKRYAIRANLIMNNYHPLQKSVWIGATPLSNNFIELLDTLELKSYVHIFSVRERGTL
ncbi:MAG: hypothetical protein A3C11_00390 [Candidatus Sungbacteria bacterium RIFCSPHIGHO2_02_FULL_49_12]|uniref:YTH domain-containing protein n=2 Tax=Parcubacteria group TaxID=1794811 RepID=A0A1G2CG16_9BACT|nr:MAG: hypothetical protein A2945_00740 [Candidatus Liptonbacteria bacterium RIFCSPLOWO2_01_FULL_52_25]OHA01265.1 MAG: hypothetical protein A3C11_00390 [Candidatus Sungbacteria bacterium RIFCSPHIGHO2_02_FULL_49_12]